MFVLLMSLVLIYVFFNIQKLIVKRNIGYRRLFSNLEVTLYSLKSQFKQTTLWLLDFQKVFVPPKRLNIQKYSIQHGLLHIVTMAVTFNSGCGVI